MSKLFNGGIAGLLLASLALGQDAGTTTDQRELRYRFKKGEKMSAALKHKMSVRLDEVPESFLGIVPEDPFTLTFEGDVDFEVVDVTEEGKATLEGKFPRLKAEGSYLGQDFTVDFDRERDGDQPKGNGDEEGFGDQGLPGMANPEEILQQLTTQTLKLEIDPRGKVKAGNAGSGGMAAQLLDLGGLMGLLPKEKVGAGSAWQNTDALSLPGLPLKMIVKSENKYEKTEKVRGQDCALIQSTFKVDTEKEDREDAMDLPIPIQAKFRGDGKGTMHFALDGGRPVKNDLKLNVKLTVTFNNQQDGQDTEIKGLFKLEQSTAIKKAKE